MGSQLAFGFEPSSSIAANRNGLVADFLGSAHEWVLFCDSDITPTPETFWRLLATGQRFVSASYFTRLPPHHLVASPIGGGNHFPRASAHPIQEANYVGLGCALIHRSVLESIPEPWFEHPIPGMGEDVVFCQRARAAGFPVHIDLSTIVGHVATFAIGAEHAERKVQRITSPAA